MKNLVKILLPICGATLSALPLTLASCGPTDPEVTKEMTIKTIDDNDLPPYIEVEKSIQIAAFDSNNKIIKNAIFTTSSDKIITIDSENHIKGISDGDAVISCNAEGFDTATITVKVVDTPVDNVELSNYLVEDNTPMLLSEEKNLEQDKLYACIINYKNWQNWNVKKPTFYYYAKSSGSVIANEIAKHVWFKANNDESTWNLLVEKQDYIIKEAVGFLDLTKDFSRKITNNSIIRIDIVIPKTKNYTFEAR